MDQPTIQFMRALSRVLGWIYTIAWSASFYPQPIKNWRRKSTHGTAIDFPFLNVVGFTCYTISTASLLCSPVIRKQYAERHPYAPLPTVRTNDLVYNIHALTLVLLTYLQFYPRIWGFDRSQRQRISRQTALVTTLCSLFIIATLVMILFQSDREDNHNDSWIWLDLIYAIGYVKLVVTFFKYIPQAYLNYQRKSTAGWSIAQILLDVLGGVMSILQLVIDASLQDDWRDAIDNPVKLGLGNISIFFDLIFIVQHYVLYGNTGSRQRSNTNDHYRQPLLESSE